MRLLPALLASLFLFSTLIGAPLDELIVMEQLVETTKKNLDTQQLLLKEMTDYALAREAYIGDPDSSRRATLLVKRAMRLHAHLEQEHLSHLLSADFLSELAFYNQVGKGQLARE